MNDNVLIISPFPCGWACVLLVSSSSRRYTSDDVVDGKREVVDCCFCCGFVWLGHDERLWLVEKGECSSQRQTVEAQKGLWEN